MDFMSSSAVEIGSGDNQLKRPRSRRWDNHVVVSTSEVEVIESTKYDDILIPDEDRVSLAIHNGLHERYQLKTSIYTTDGYPSCYAYYTDSDKVPLQAAHFPVEIDETFSRPRFKQGMEKMWIKLKELEQDKLYILLIAGLSISKSVYYDKKQKCWVRQFGCPAGDTENFALKYYVHPFPEPGLTLLKYLERGRTKDEMKKCVTNLTRSQFNLHRLDIAWVAALDAGMTNGIGRTAVSQLLDAIVALIPGLEMPEELPAASVFHLTSSTLRDSFSISSSSLSSSSRECTSPDAKYRKTDEEPVLARDKTSKRKKRNAEEVKVVTPKHHRHYVDLSVITFDVVSGVYKYLFLVEIHSAGKTFEQATQKFMQEIVNVLQAQSQVFGLFFSKLTVLLYSAGKGLDGKITISKEEYTLLKFSREDENFDYDIFCVPHFQKLVMDIFSCIIHGIKNVDA